jgi:putative superfamily III holin-X
MAKEATSRAVPLYENEKSQSTLELIRGIATDTGTLVRKEIELARQEITESVIARVKAVGAFAAAGVLMLMVVIFGGHAAAMGLSRAMPDWAAYLVVAGVFIVLAGGAAMFGLRRIKRPSFTPEETQRTIKEDVEWAKEQLKR